MRTAAFTMNFKMKKRFLAWGAALLCCISCIDTNTTLGGSFVPASETYTFYTTEFPLEGISMQMADNLSGYSDTRITIGAIRDPEFGLTTRASAFSLVPIFLDEYNPGKNPVFKSFHFAASRDTLSVQRADQQNILQKIRVYELSAALDPETDFNSNKPLAHRDKIISRGTPVYGGTDSLSFNFTEEFGKKYLQITPDDIKDMKTYLSKFPGIYLEVDAPDGEGGRINMLDLQMGYDKQNKSVTGNIATLSYSAEFDGVRKDTVMAFYFGATGFYNIDSLFTAYGVNNTGTFPQYALNLTGQETRERVGDAQDKIWIEGGGGLKPVISARSLKRQVEEAIAAAGGDPGDAVINKASLVFPFEFPEDYNDMVFWPYRLSPTCRIVSDSGTSFMGLSDSGSSSENQGDVDRSLLTYSPDITFHMQEILKVDESLPDKTNTQYLMAGNYDIWLLVMAKEKVTNVSATSEETQQMLDYYAYNSYYNDGMYGGYGGYGYGGYGYGYGGYGYGYGYNNYYTMAMYAAQARQVQTTTSESVKLDRDRFYCAALNGPQSTAKVPTMKLTFALPNEE